MHRGRLRLPRCSCVLELDSRNKIQWYKTSTWHILPRLPNGSFLESVITPVPSLQVRPSAMELLSWTGVLPPETDPSAAS